MYLTFSFKIFICFASYQNLRIYIIINVCMPMHSLTYVQKGYVVIDLVIIWN